MAGRSHNRESTPGAGAQPGFGFVPNVHTNQLVLDENAGIGVFGLAFKAADVILQKGYIIMRAPNTEIRRLVRKHVWLRTGITPPGEE